MKRILITGATGNVGTEVIRFFMEMNTANDIYAGVRDVNTAKRYFQKYPSLKYRYFDFQNLDTFDEALTGINSVFLLRPPHISDVEAFFKPLIAKIKEKNIAEIVFLSVQGAEKSKVIPHNKIEKLIVDSGCAYIFLRPSYFMQNLTTTHIIDIKEKKQIILPSGKAVFNWIDIANIGEIGAIIFDRFSEYKNRAIELTGYENKNFYTVTVQMSKILHSSITFKSVSPFKFYNLKKREGVNKGLIFVMIILHFLPRLQKPPKISDFYKQITGKIPTSLDEFLNRESSQLIQS